MRVSEYDKQDCERFPEQLSSNPATITKQHKGGEHYG
jgi:hypothetical protein